MSSKKLQPTRARRDCVARRVSTWSKEEAIARLYAGKGEDRFLTLGAGTWPANETRFDVAQTRDEIIVSVMAVDAGNSGLVMDGLQRESESIEVFFDPFADRIGYHQFIAGSSGSQMVSSHWPYRDPARQAHCDPSWSLEVEERIERPDMLRFYFLRFAREPIAAGKVVGFNVGRAQTRSQEISSWNVTTGIGFPDAGCFGRLWLSPPPLACEEANIEVSGRKLSAVQLTGVSARQKAARLGLALIGPEGTELKRWKPRTVAGRMRFACASALPMNEPGRYRIRLLASASGKDVDSSPVEFTFDAPGRKRQPFLFQGTYDWPDNAGNVVYTPKDLAAECLWYKDCGLDRINWIDYAPATWKDKATRKRSSWFDKMLETEKHFGGDLLPGAVRAAHQAGQEFVTIFKPLEQKETEPFIADHPEFCLRRNPAWQQGLGEPITAIRVYQSDTSPIPLTAKSLELWESKTNRRYTRLRRPQIKEGLVNRPLSVWSPRGLIPGPEKRKVRCLTVTGFTSKASCLALQIRKCRDDLALHNRGSHLVEFVTESGKVVPCLVAGAGEIPKWGFDFGPRTSNSPSWARADAGIDSPLWLQGSTLALGMSREQPFHMPGFQEVAFPEVREFWLSYLKRGIDAGADGVSIRLAHHVGCVDWLAYMYAEPVLEAFRSEFGREPEPCNEDYTRIRIIRGRFYTEFVREASAMARRAGKKFMHHIENRMLVPPQFDTYCQ
ncbi:MAG: DOMON domain-containing protein, partial [Planctomycetota bacterium]